MSQNQPAYDAIVVISFGGPERPEDVIPFLENVTRGRNVPRERLEEVAEHYGHFGGRSPINDQVRALIAAWEPALRNRGIGLPIFWGNRNWHPYLADTVRDMRGRGVRGAPLGLVLSAYSSYSSCRQYLEDIVRARETTGPDAPAIEKVRAFYNHPGFVAANADHLRMAIEKFATADRASVHVAYTAHSIPTPMADQCRYAEQLAETCRLVSKAAGVPGARYQLVYQSRSGRPSDPWLGPDICDHLAELATWGVRNVVILPVGFLSDHVEVLFDLDKEAAQKAEQLGMNFMRAASVGTHPAFVEMLCDVVAERLTGSPQRKSIGQFGPSHDVCTADCCPMNSGSRR